MCIMLFYHSRVPKRNAERSRCPQMVVRPTQATATSTEGWYLAFRMTGRGIEVRRQHSCVSAFWSPVPRSLTGDRRRALQLTPCNPPSSEFPCPQFACPIPPPLTQTG